MWSDPIESALLNLRTALDTPEAEGLPSIAFLRRTLSLAVAAREFEKQEGRLVTPQDPL